MKKLITSLCLLVLIGISANVMAQSTGFRPYVGDTKTYQVTANTGDTYTWTLTLSATDATTGDLLPAGTIASAPAGYSGINKNSIAITWVNPTVPTIYYLHLVETNSGGCSNHKVLAIQPQNNFKLEIANINAGNTSTLTTTYATCAPTVVVDKWNGTGTVDDIAEAQNFTYKYGITDFYYRIEATGINSNTTTWNADFTVAETAGGTVTVEYVTGATVSTAPVWSSATAGIVGTNNVVVPVNKMALFIHVKIDNGTANETLVDESITTTIEATSKENLGNQAAILINTNTVQTQSARPDSGAITTP